MQIGGPALYAANVELRRYLDIGPLHIPSRVEKTRRGGQQSTCNRHGRVPTTEAAV